MTFSSLIGIAINLAIMHSYRMTSTFGMSGFEYYPQTNVLSYEGEEMVVDEMRLKDGLITGFEGRPINIEAEEEVIFRLGFVCTT